MVALGKHRFTDVADEERLAKRAKSKSQELSESAGEAKFQVAIPQHPLAIKPLGNAYVASHNLKALCGGFKTLPDELIIQILEILDASSLVRLGSTCKALYAFTRADELWRALFLA